MITQEELKSVLSYDNDTGVFTWLITSGNARAGKEAGHKCNKFGYKLIGIKRRTYQASVLAWIYVHGETPKGYLMYGNGDTFDTRIKNLVLGDFADTKSNATKANVNNHSSGLLGVHWNEKLKKWRALIGYNRKNIHLGLFDDKHEAHKAYLKAKKIYHPKSRLAKQCQ